MSFELLVAIRYLKAKRKHAAISVITLVSIVGVAAGVAALVIALAINAGFREDLQEKLLGSTQAHVTLLSAKGKGIEGYRALMTVAEGIEGVVAASPAVYGKMMISSASTASVPDFVVVKGIVAKDEIRISDLARNVLRDGGLEFDSPPAPGKRPPILLGRHLSAALDVKVGDRVQLTSLETEISPIGPRLRPMSFEVAAVFESGLFEHDSAWVYIPMDAAQRLLRLDDVAMTIEVKIRDLYQAQTLGDKIAATAGHDLRATNWIVENSKIFHALKLERMVMFITIGLIVMVAALNIVGSLTMMVLEKARDIAILMAMGATPQSIRRIFVWQGVVIGVVGTFTGLILGNTISFVANYYQVVHLDAEVYSIGYVPFRISAGDSVIIAIVAIAISFLATLYPSAEAAKLEPVETLRYE